ncbi:hypothetical protein [Chimaeribacter arupi]|uniref:Uncharacterized protein n=1 Tax=Chimaeribacter arupi TaxID=2060066 RepID=A0A2N5EKH8_9GAMM|nr:hypothetical protein [Chimaeribacter arupi]PLR47022.1 hypothetical protein CYR34_14865 [Chimaeribacter arupi]
MKDVSAAGSDTLFLRLQQEIDSLPPAIQANAKQLLNDGTNGTTFYAIAKILAEKEVNDITITFSNNWPWVFSSDSAVQFIDENIYGDFGIIASTAIGTMVQLTTNITVYLDPNFLLIFFFDAALVQLGSYIGPGTTEGNTALTQSSISGTWSIPKTDKDA